MRFSYEPAGLTASSLTGDASIYANASECLATGQLEALRACIDNGLNTPLERVIKIEGPGGLVLEYSYDNYGNLAHVRRLGTDSISEPTETAEWSYTYLTGQPQTPTDLTHVLSSVTNPNGNTTVYESNRTDAKLPISEITYGEGLERIVTDFVYQSFPESRIALVSDGNGHISAYEMDAHGYTTKITAPRDAVWLFGYNQDGTKAFEVDPLGLRTEYGYDALGNMTMVSKRGAQPDQVVTTSTRYNTLFCVPTETTDPNGYVTRYDVDPANGNVRSVTLPTGSRITYAYAPNGDVVSVTDERNLVTQFEDYDPYGNPRLIRRPVNATQSVVENATYDVRSRPTSNSGTLLPSTTRTYDALDRVVFERSEDTLTPDRQESTTTRASYYKGGQLHTRSVEGSSSGLVYSADFTIDTIDRVKTVQEIATQAGTYYTSIGYDNNGNVVETTDRRGVITTQRYDELNFPTETYVGQKLVQATNPDKVGNALSQTDVFGNVVTMSYDWLHRLSGRTYNDASGPMYTEHFGYDNNGNPTSFVDRNGRTWAKLYDAINRPKQLNKPIGHIVSWDYQDSLGKVVEQQLPQNLTTTRTVDGLGRPVKDEQRYSVDGAVWPTLTTQYTYNDAQRSVSVVNPRGFTTVVKNSAFGLPVEQTVDNRLTTTWSRHVLGSVATATDPEGRTTDYSIDGFNRVARVDYAKPGVYETFDYDGVGNLKTHRDRRVVVTSMEYDDLSRPVKRSVGAIVDMTATFDDANSRETHVDAEGRSTQIAFDTLHRVVAVTNAMTDTMTYGYDGVGNRTSETNFRGYTTQYGFDNADRLESVVYPDGSGTSIAYLDSLVTTQTTTDRRGFAHVEKFDALGRTISQVSDGQLIASYQYDANSNRTAMTDGLGNITTYSYDGADWLETIEHPAGLQTEHFTYDRVGNVRTYSDGFGGAVTKTYDELNYLDTVTLPTGEVTNVDVDGAGLVTRRVDPSGAITQFGYNDWGTLTHVTDAEGGTWLYEYSNTQFLKKVTDAENRMVVYQPDVLDRVSTMTQFTGTEELVTQFTYDKNSNVATRTDPKGQVATYTYDAVDRLKTASWSNVSGTGPRSYTYGYTFEGEIDSVVEETVAPGNTTSTTRNYSRSYDGRGRVLSEIDASGREVRYTWDAANNLKTVEDPTRRGVRYTYDQMNRLDEVQLDANGAVVANYDWTADGKAASVSYGSGMTRTYGYDPSDRLSSVTNQIGLAGQPGSTSEQFSYTYDANSNRHTEERRVDGQVTATLTYGYDLLDRLRSVECERAGGATQSIAYTYDKVGNRTTETGTRMTGEVVARTFEYDQANRMTTVSGTGGPSESFEYDRNGNLTEWTRGSEVKTFTYDARDQMRQAVVGGAEVASFDYDFERRRTTKKDSSGTAIGYVYAGSNVIAEYSGGSLVNRFDYGTDIVHAEIGGEGHRWYFSDGQGSITSLGELNQSGVAQLASRVEFDPWGEVVSQSSPSLNRIGYTGQRLDAETGLMPLGNGERYYLPGHGRFIQQDSWMGDAMMPQSLNCFAYVNGNPLMYVDPTGHEGTIRDGIQYQGKYADSTLGYAYNLSVDTLYQAFDMSTLGAFGRQDVIDQQYRRGQISAQMAIGKSTLNLVQALAELGVMVGTAGLGSVVGGTVRTGVLAGRFAPWVGRALMGAYTAAEGTGQMLFHDFLSVQFGFQNEYSPWWMYTLVGVASFGGGYQSIAKIGSEASAGKSATRRIVESLRKFGAEVNRDTFFARGGIEVRCSGFDPAYEAMFWKNLQKRMRVVGKRINKMIEEERVARRRATHRDVVISDLPEDIPEPLAQAVHAYQARINEDVKNGRAWPGSATAEWDEATGMVTTGIPREGDRGPINSTYESRFDEIGQRSAAGEGKPNRIVGESLEPYPRTNCSEFSAHNKGLNNGINESTTHMFTWDPATGVRKTRCLNCQISHPSPPIKKIWSEPWTW